MENLRNRIDAKPVNNEKDYLNVHAVHLYVAQNI